MSGEWGGDGSTFDSSGDQGSWWLSGAASVVLEERWGGEREERVVLGWRSVFPVGRYGLPSWYGGWWCAAKATPGFITIRAGLLVQEAAAVEGPTAACHEVGEFSVQKPTGVRNTLVGSTNFQLHSNRPKPKPITYYLLNILGLVRTQ